MHDDHRHRLPPNLPPHRTHGPPPASRCGAGIISRGKDGGMQCVPLFSRILSLFAESNDLQFAVPGGLIGVGTMIDPTLTRADRLVGQVLGSVGLGLGLTLTLA